jgi:CRISPR/Cas system CSM-associated protein Csm3 (group 7 of RAMP superfamily)
MKKRYIAHITLEADTPLKIGSADSDFIKDSPIQRDWNGLPMILGTSIAGVLRKDFEGDADDIFGKENGSKVIFSNALLVDENSRVNEELLLSKSPFLKLFDKLPQREHTAITQKGVAKEHSKFDEEVVYKGTRFRFALEMLEDESAFAKLLEMLQSPSFRVGGGSTKGFGKFKVVEILSSVIDTAEALATYSSSLNSTEGSRVELSTNVTPTKHSTYKLKITPDDFFMFGSGFGDKDANQTPVYEQVIDYKKGKLGSKQILIPASSVKGALSHRTAFYYNKAIGATIESGEAKVDENNDAVKAIFGHKKELAEDKKTELGQKGKLLISDCFKEDKKETKVFDHVSIDRFTGGAIDRHLFQEKTTAQSDVWELEILLENGVDDVFVEAFERALDDVCSGMLALGGATTKGHGVFSGSWSKL